MPRRVARHEAQEQHLDGPEPKCTVPSARSESLTRAGEQLGEPTRGPEGFPPVYSSPMQVMPARLIRVVIVDDHEIVRHGLKAVLARHASQVRVVAEAGDAQSALDAVTTFDPDVVLVDLRLGAASGLDLATELMKRQPGLKVVILTVYEDEQYVYQALRTGVAGYLLKRVDGPELVRHLANVVAGQVVIDPTLAGRLATAAARLQHGEFWPGAHLGLTQRESEVLSLMVAGLSNRAIASKLIVGEETVKSHAGAIYRKLGVTDRAGAVAVAIREGLFR